MILSDGTDTREEVRRPGPACDGMAVVLDRVWMNGDTGDEYETNEGDGSGFARYGRRIFWWDSRGFYGSTRYATESEAHAVFVETLSPYDETVDDYSL